MKSYTKRYPNTGSTLTINYPDGLFSDIVEDPRTLYRVSQESELYYTPYDFDDQGNKIYQTDKDYGRQAYPDLILIPANGSFINEHADMDEITTVRSFRRNDNGVWEKTDERIDEIHKKADGDYYHISIYGTNQLWFRSSNPNTLIDDRCYSCGEISIHESMETNEIDNCVPSDLSERYAYDTRETHITITIYGEARFFKSNATHYFCAGKSETNGTLYCNSYFGEGKKVVGGFHIRDKDKKIIELRPVSLTNRGGRGSRYYACKGSNGETRVLDFSNCHEYHDYDGVVVPYLDSSYQELNYEDCFCEGFRFKRDLNQFWGKNLEIDGKPLFKEEQLTYRNSNIQFILEPIVAVSTGYAPHGWGDYLYLKPQGMETQSDDQGNEVLVEKQPSIEVELNVDYDDEDSFSSIMKVWNNFTWNDDETIFYIIPFVKFANYCRGENKWATKYVFMPLSSFQFMGNTINYIYGYDNSVGFSGYFTTCKDYWTPNQYLVAPWQDSTQNKNKNIPLYEYGVTLYPVMTKPQCMYMKLNTDKALDKDNLFGNLTKNHNKIISSLEKTYGTNYIERNITEWNENTLKDELRRLIDSTCRFKILYINCHGGFWKDPQRSYAILSDVGEGSNYFTKGALDCLLKNRREDEFYFIYFASCFSGGLMEETNHTNVDAEDYTWIVPDPNLGDGCLLWYSDCSNSPAWGSTDGDGVCDLFKFNDLKTYKEQADDINSSVNKCRIKNIQYLVDFLQRHYTFLKDTFLDGTALNWTEETYNKSITNAPNLIIRLSKEREKNTITDADGTKRKEINPEYTKLLKQYPIMLLFYILFKLNKYSNISKPLKTVKKQEFMNTMRGYLHYINDVKEILDTHSIAVNHLDEEHDFLFDTDIWEEDDADFKKDASKKELLENYINFFYDLYVLMSNILKQSQEIYDTNSFGEYNDILNSLIDDIPGVVVYGEEFGQCKFPKFPGFNELYDCISEESLNKMLYKYNGGDSQ